MTQVFLATRNVKKLAEMQRILAEHAPGIVVVGMDDVPAYDEPVEDQPTFEGNALLKARAGTAATGLPSLADDSGLCVDALNGMPGVLSARWAGPPQADHRNNELLLAQLCDVPDDRRGAHFACAVAFCHPDGSEIVVHGQMAGRVIRELRGSGGFGYDALFVADEHLATSTTSAELSAEDKDRISHRGRALREIAPAVAAAARVTDVSDDGCPFCSVPEDQVIARVGPCFAIWTGEQPEGSAMVLPAEHRAAPWDLTEDEWAATQTLLRSVMDSVSTLHSPQGWNVGWNVGQTGGQSVAHAHCHLIPRYADEPFAERGIRWWFKHADNARP